MGDELYVTDLDERVLHDITPSDVSDAPNISVKQRGIRKSMSPESGTITRTMLISMRVLSSNR